MTRQGGSRRVEMTDWSAGCIRSLLAQVQGSLKQGFGTWELNASKTKVLGPVGESSQAEAFASPESSARPVPGCGSCDPERSEREKKAPRLAANSAEFKSKRAQT